MINGPPSFKYHEGFGRFVVFMRSCVVKRKRLYNIYILDEYFAIQPIDNFCCNKIGDKLKEKLPGVTQAFKPTRISLYMYATIFFLSPHRFTPSSTCYLLPVARALFDA